MIGELLKTRRFETLALPHIVPRPSSHVPRPTSGVPSLKLGQAGGHWIIQLELPRHALYVLILGGSGSSADGSAGDFGSVTVNWTRKTWGSYGIVYRVCWAALSSVGST